MTLPSTWIVLWVGLLVSGGLIDAFNRNRKSTDGEENITKTSPQNNQSLLAQIVDPLFGEEETDDIRTRSKRTTFPDNVHRLLIFLSPDDKRSAYESLVSASQLSIGSAPNFFLAGYLPYSPFFVGINTLYLPIPFCFPPFPFLPPTDEEMDSDWTGELPNIEKKFGFPDSADNSLNSKPGTKPEVKPTDKAPKVDFNVYYNTITGVDLKPVKPLRPPSIAVPPADHSMGNNDNDSVPKRPESNVPVPKPNRPLTTERPDYKVVTAGTFEDESMITLQKAIEECCKPGSKPNCFDMKGFSFVDERPCSMQ